MKKKAFITICAGMLCLGAYVLSSDNLSATKTADEIQLYNAKALSDGEDDNFFITCTRRLTNSDPDNCEWVCKVCGFHFKKTDGYSFGTKHGKCPNCGD